MGQVSQAIRSASSSSLRSPGQSIKRLEALARLRVPVAALDQEHHGTGHAHSLYLGVAKPLDTRLTAARASGGRFCGCPPENASKYVERSVQS